MPDITDLRALLRDRQSKEQLGRERYYVCLDPDLARELFEARAELDESNADQARQARRDRKADNRLSVPADTPQTSPEAKQLTARVAKLEAQVKAVTIRLEFRALPATRYEALLSEHPEARDGDNLAALETFQDALAIESFKGVYLGDGDKPWLDADGHTLTLTEILDGLTFGEKEPIRMLVLALNRRKVDTPFSARRSATTRR